MASISSLPGGGGLQPRSPRSLVSPTNNSNTPSDNSNHEDTDDDSKGIKRHRLRRRHEGQISSSSSRDGRNISFIGSDQRTLSIRLFLRNPLNFIRARLRRRRSRVNGGGGGTGSDCSLSCVLLLCALTTICLVFAFFSVLSKESKIDANITASSGVGVMDKGGGAVKFHHHKQQKYIKRKNSSTNSYFPPRLLRYYVQTIKKDNIKRRKNESKNHRGQEEAKPQLSSQVRVIGSINPKTQVKPLSHDLKRYSPSRKRDKPSLPERWEDEKCEAMVEWQKLSFPTCNHIHEVDLMNDLRVGPEPKMPPKAVEEEGDDDDDNKKTTENKEKQSKEEEEEDKNKKKIFNLGPGFGFELTPGVNGIEYNYMANEIKSKVVNHGYFRDVWMIRDGDGIQKRALKTLRYEQKVSGYNNERHRRDAVAVERLTSNPYILDIYGYCGNSALFEYSEQGDIYDAIYDSDPPPSKQEKLRIAAQVATGVAAVHEVGWNGYAAMAHTDISPDQFMLIDGVYKLNDFNRVRFIRKNRKTNKPCTYTVGNNPGEFRSPEEYRYDGQTEKVDVYSMGNTFYVILMRKTPFKLEGADSSKAKDLVMDGERPKIHSKYTQSNDPAVQAIVHAIEMCLVHDPDERASAAEVRDYLIGEMDKLGLSLN